MRGRTLIWNMISEINIGGGCFEPNVIKWPLATEPQCLHPFLILGPLPEPDHLIYDL